MRLTRDYFNNIEIPAYILCKANGERIGEIQCVDQKTLSINELNEISFNTYKYIDGTENEIYDLITEMKYVILPGLFKFIITSVNEEDDGVNPQKTVTAQSIEVNLGQRYLEQFYINNGEDYAINNVKLYDKNDRTHSLLDLVLSEKCPDWSVGYVDPEITGSQRFFEIERTDIYSFLTNDVASAFGAIVTFNSWNMTINVYKEENFGSDTNIFINYNNLLESATLSSSVDEIKTCMTVIGADDLNLREVNMGSDRLYMFDYYATPEFMSNDLCLAYGKWKEKMATNRVRYSECVNQTIQLYHDINYLMNEKMPTFGDNKLVLPDFSPIVINGVTFTTDVYAQKITANGTATADVEYVLSNNLGSVLTVDEFYKFNGCPVQPSAETFPTPRLQDYYILWYNPNDESSKEELTAIDKGYGNEKKYEDGYSTISIIIKSGTEMDNVNFIPAVYKPESECKDWYRYGLNPLKEKLAEYEGKQAVMIKAGWGDENNANYQTQYLPVYNTIQDIKAQIIVVEQELKNLNDQLTAVHDEMSVIATDCAMNSNFTSEQIVELSRFIREESINSDNYVITDSMTDEERIAMLQDMLDYGETELRKVSQPQIQFSLTMANLFNIKEFDDISMDFERGNYVHVILRDDYVVKARLLSMDFDFYNMAELSVTFGNTNKVKGRTLFTDITKAINTATSVSTTVSVKGSYWNAANQDINEVNSMLQDGLVAAGQSIKTSTSDVEMNDNGILLKSTDPSYPNDRILIGGSRILFSADDLKTVREAIGRCKYVDKNGVVHDEFGVISDFVISGYINGTTIDASEINIGGSSDGKIVMYDANGNIAGWWDKNGMKLPSNATISWYNVEDAPTIPQNTSDLNNDEHFITATDLPTKVSQLTNDAGYQTASTIRETVITKDYIESLNIRAASIDADNITGDQFKGKSISLIQDSGNADSSTVAGFSLTARHLFNNDFDYMQAQISNGGGLVVTSRKLVNTDSTPTTQNDYVFYQLNMSRVRGLTNPAVIYGMKNTGYIETQYQYLDDAADTYDERLQKHKEELSHIVYTGSAETTFKITNDGDYYSYNGSDYVQMSGNDVKLHKGSTDAHASFAKNKIVHDYGSGVAETQINISSDLLAIVDLTNGYQVFITNTSSASTTYVEKQSGYFIVHGTAGATFDYDVVLKIND